MSKFQVILIAIFVVCALAGVALFATFRSGGETATLPPITIWGTLPENTVMDFIVELNSELPTPLLVTYIEKSEATFDAEFIEALASQKAPDAILVPQQLLARHEDKVIAIPATVLTERDFKNTYVSQAELYLNSNREPLALPLTIDPLVMYWNRDLFTNAGFATYPRYWDEFGNIIEKVSLRDVNANIRRSALAMGEFTNITNAKELLGTLLLQAGNPVTARGDETTGGRMVSALGDGMYEGSKYSIPAVTFFTQFTNPRSSFYSWNRGLPTDKSWFLSGSLATYFGFASELFDIRSKNPNIDFDVAPLPQARGGNNRVTYGKMYGFSIVKSTPNPTATFTVLQTLVAPPALAILGKKSYLPPVRRDMIGAGSTDPYLEIFYDSALISKGWLDMNAGKTREIFQTMVESITSGRADVYSAVQTAHQALDLTLRK